MSMELLMTVTEFEIDEGKIPQNSCILFTDTTMVIIAAFYSICNVNVQFNYHVALNVGNANDKDT